MRIAVTGRQGQIVQALVECGSRLGHEIVSVGRPEFDLAGDTAVVRQALATAAADAIVSAAAYTAVDKAESESDLAFAMNERGARVVADAANDLGVPLVHLSTDYVFDGCKNAPYIETDPTLPLGTYGASKLAGERAVLTANPNSVILRTAWVYSPFGTNFVKTMLRLAREQEDVAVVADQHGNPTSALDLADGILLVVQNLLASNDPDQRGLFHMASAGEATWADFAEAIFSSSAALHGPAARVSPISAADYAAAAKRPANSRLDCSKLLDAHGVSLPEWHWSVPQVVRRLVL